MNLVTLSDYNYLICGLALYDSIFKHTNEPFTLHYLAVDDQTFDKLTNIESPHLTVYSIDEVKEKENDSYDLLCFNHPANTPDGQSPYHFALASFFTDYVMTYKQPESTLYLDADLYFHNSAKLIFDAMIHHSIGLISHKHMSPDEEHYVGYWNQGATFFKNDMVGRACLKWWRDVVIDPLNEWAKTHGTCGDQKYLELFFPLFGSEHIKCLDEDVGVLSPWNASMSKYEDGMLTWEAGNVTGDTYLTQKLVFCHFSHFDPDFEKDIYSIDRAGEWGGTRNYNEETKILERVFENGIDELYDGYFQQLKETRERYSL